MIQLTKTNWLSTDETYLDSYRNKKDNPNINLNVMSMFYRDKTPGLVLEFFITFFTHSGFCQTWTYNDKDAWEKEYLELRRLLGFND